MSNLKHSLYNFVHENEEIFNFIQESAINGFWFLDVCSTNKIYINPKLYYSLGFDLESIESDHIPPSKILSQQELNKVLNSINKEDSSAKLNIEYKDHASNPIEFNCNILGFKDSNSEITHILVGNMDCSNGSQQILEYQQHLQRYEQILDGTNIGTWEWNIQTGETIFKKLG